MYIVHCRVVRFHTFFTYSLLSIIPREQGEYKMYFVHCRVVRFHTFFIYSLLSIILREQGEYCTLYIVHCTVGWFDFTLFSLALSCLLFHVSRENIKCTLYTRVGRFCTFFPCPLLSTILCEQGEYKMNIVHCRVVRVNTFFICPLLFIIPCEQGE